MKKIFFLFILCTLFLVPLIYSQNVGIGTTTPAFKLDVKNGSINTDSVYRIGGSKVLSVNLQNTFVGIGTANSITTGNFNTAAGYEALYSNTIGERNTAFGLWALYSNTGGNRNTAFGKSALHLNSTGSFSTANGFETLYYNTTGEKNTAVGHHAMLFNTTGNDNTASGYLALANNTTAHSNTANGSEALRFHTTGDFNTATGYKALYANITGINNTAIGYGALINTTGAAENTAIGSGAGETYNNSSGNVFVGCKADVAAAGLITTLAVGYRTIVATSATARFGNPSTSSIGGFVSWTNLSDGRYKKNVKENVPGLEFINKLRPVTYTLDATGLDAFYHKNEKKRDSLSTGVTAFFQTALQEKEKITYTGFIAQEVEATAKAMGFDFSGVDAAKNENDTYGLRYAEFVVPLVKAVQELSKENAELKKLSTQQMKLINNLLERMQKHEEASLIIKK
jgi:trimeric autotransporter adhesin